MNPQYFEAYTSILREEILPAVGCAEAISLAFCAAKAHEVLGMQPTAVTVSLSTGVLKNVKNAVIPNTNGLKGIRAAVAAGIVCGDSSQGMQVLQGITQEQIAAADHFDKTVRIDVACAETECPIYISVTLYARTSYSRVVIANGHSNIVEIMKNGEAILKKPIGLPVEEDQLDLSCLNLHDIVSYAEQVDLHDVKDLLDMQIVYNTTICEEGLSKHYGTDIGRILISEQNPDVKTTARAYAAAGCDAKMNGCDMPIALLCGSGNQGITASVPVICYAKHFSVENACLYRALLISDLLSVYLRTRAGHTSSSCGAIFSGCAAGAAIAYLLERSERAVASTLRNSVSLIPENVCSGTGAACAATVASAVELGIWGYQMYRKEGPRNISGEDTTRLADEAVRSICNHSDGMIES